MNVKEYDRFAATRGDVTLGQAEALVKTARDGDLHHIDGPFIRALADLADTGRAEVYGCEIDRTAGEYRITKRDRERWASDALGALVEAHQAQNPFRFQYWKTVEGPADTGRAA